MSSPPTEETIEEETIEEKPFRFRMRTLLLVMTGACVLGAVLSKTMEPRHQIGFWILAVVYPVVFLFILRQRRKQLQHIAALPSKGIAVYVDAKWLRRVKSPWFMVIGALTGVAVTFCPLFLIWCGSVSEYGLLEWIVVPLCVIIIYVVPGFYMRLAGEVLNQLAKMEVPAEQAAESEETNISPVS